MRNGMTKVPKRFMNVPPKRIHRTDVRRRRTPADAVGEMPDVCDRPGSDFRVTLSRPPQRHQADEDGDDEQQENGDGAADGDDALHRPFPNFLKPTFRINPMAM